MQDKEFRFSQIEASNPGAMMIPGVNLKDTDGDGMISRGWSTPQQQNAGAVHGTVVRDATGGPLSKATIELRGGQVQQTTTTENDGRFYFRDLPFGAYDVSIRRDGFAPAEYGQKWPGGPGIPLQVRSGQPAPDLTIRMAATSSISGRITGSNGQPMANASYLRAKTTVYMFGVPSMCLL